MDTIEKIQRYIKKTGRKPTKRGLILNEAVALANNAEQKPTQMICLAFDYGYAKGYRAAKAEAKEKEQGWYGVLLHWMEKNANNENDLASVALFARSLSGEKIARTLQAESAVRA